MLLMAFPGSPTTFNIAPLFPHMRQPIVFFISIALLFQGAALGLFDHGPLQPDDTGSAAGDMQDFGVQWEKSYGRLALWSARYEGPQPVGDADNDGLNELLIGGRDPFMRVMQWDEAGQTYVEQARIMDPVLGIGYSLFGLGSATGFFIGDADNDGDNDVGVAWGRHFSAFEWDGSRYQKIGQHIVTDAGGWETTLDCMVGDVDSDGANEVVVTGGYRSGIPEVLVLQWNGDTFTEESSWNAPGSSSVYFPWIADVDDDGANEIIVNTNETVVLNWDGAGWQPTVVARYGEETGYPFGCVSKDSDNDGKPEIHVTFYTPELAIYEWTGDGYEQKYHHIWQGEDATIEAIDVGDVDDDGIPEVCVGTNLVHVLQWNNDTQTYVEEYLIDDTYGMLAVTCVGDMDNDGSLEINAGAVGVDSRSTPYKAWILKYGWSE